MIRAAALKLVSHPGFERAAPTPDHFIPLLYLAGLAAEEGAARAMPRGYAMGSPSMTCYGVGNSNPGSVSRREGPPGCPKDRPADQTNI